MLHHILEGWKCLFGARHLSELDDFFLKADTSLCLMDLACAVTCCY